MKRKVNPNRMMLLRLRRRLELARRGHRLLKNKQEKLMQVFISLTRRCVEARREIDAVFMEISLLYLAGRSTTDRRSIEDALAMTTTAGRLETEMRSEMNVRTPRFVFHVPDRDPAYRLSATSPELDAAFERLAARFQDLLDLAASENALLKLAAELEKTRRRVNALEYVLIPDLADQIRSIEDKLAEAERGTQTRLMKIKDMLEARQKPGAPGGDRQG